MIRRRLRSAIGRGLRRFARFASRRDALALAPGVTLVEFGDPEFDVFFGYYDVTPFGSGDQSLLAVRRPIKNNTRAAGSPIELGVYNLGEPTPRFRQFASSKAWCWQQGCRLQWWRDGFDRCVIYNRSEDGQHQSVVQNTETGQILSTFDRAVYSVSCDGGLALSLNFARLQRMRPGYGYGDLQDPFEDEASPSRDGIWLVDLQKGESRLLLSLAEIAARAPESSMQGAKHYFNHLLWSPGASRFFFLHLWQTPAGKRHSRAFIWDMASGTMQFLGAKDHFSHHWWQSEDRLLAYSTHEDTGCHYHLYDLASGDRHVLRGDLLTQDGHASVSPTNTNLMLTDTYPDRSFEQHMLLYDMERELVVPLGRFFSPPRFHGEVRCDLHPRWSRDGNLVCVDSAHRGVRRLCVLNIEGLLSEAGYSSSPMSLSGNTLGSRQDAQA